MTIIILVVLTFSVRGTHKGMITIIFFVFILVVGIDSTIINYLLLITCYCVIFYNCMHVYVHMLFYFFMFVCK